MTSLDLSDISVGLSNLNIGDKLVVILSNDGFQYVTNLNYLRVSQLLSTTFLEDPETTKLTVNFDSRILTVVFDYISKANGVDVPQIERPLRSKVMIEAVNPRFTWAALWIDELQKAKGNTILYDLIMAANYLGINGLLFLACAKVASLIKGEPVNRVESILNRK